MGITAHHGNYQLSMTNDHNDDDDDDRQINYTRTIINSLATHETDGPYKTTHTHTHTYLCDPPDDFRNAIFTPVMKYI